MPLRFRSRRARSSAVSVSGTTRTRRHINCPETFVMTTIRCLAAVAGLLVLASCTRVENIHLSSPVLPMQEPTHAAQAPVLDLDNVLHVGAAAAPRVDAEGPALLRVALCVTRSEAAW